MPILIHQANMPILIHQAKTPFWTIQPPKGVKPNPLGYYCAPNAADCRYAATDSIENFIAYGFMECWLSPDNFGPWERLERNDIQWLREYFLQMLETTLQLLYSGEFELEPGEPYDQFDLGHENSLQIGNRDENPDDEEICLEWQPHHIGTDGCISFDLICSATNTTGICSGEEPVTIFLGRKAYENMDRVRSAISFARQVNNLTGIRSESAVTSELWDKLGVRFHHLPDFKKGADGEFILPDFRKWADEEFILRQPFIPANFIED